jgi:hypothetical protein
MIRPLLFNQPLTGYFAASYLIPGKIDACRQLSCVQLPGSLAGTYIFMPFQNNVSEGIPEYYAALRCNWQIAG